MISNDERREVAARLREQKPWDICTEFKYCEPERICRYEHIEGTWYKTSCGERYDGVVPPNYCPNCGAKVMA